MKTYYAYILINHTNTTFYIGVTNNINRRILEHQSGGVPGFTQKYHLKKLIYLEESANIIDAIAREKQLKNWHRDWKINLIKSLNPSLNDLSYQAVKALSCPAKNDLPCQTKNDLPCHAEFISASDLAISPDPETSSG